MASFRYQGLQGDAPRQGEIEAADRRAALNTLKGMGITPLQLDQQTARAGRQAGRQGGGFAFGRGIQGKEITAVTRQLATLAKAGVEGKLASRADSSRHQGDFRKVVEGVNSTLDAVVGPLNVAADYVNQIAQGVIPKPITDRYNGDFDTLKNNLNRLSDRLRLISLKSPW